MTAVHRNKPVWFGSGERGVSTQTQRHQVWGHVHGFLCGHVQEEDVSTPAAGPLSFVSLKDVRNISVVAEKRSSC